MARLGLAIHEFRPAKPSRTSKLVDPKAKPWDDGVGGPSDSAYFRRRTSAYPLGSPVFLLSVAIALARRGSGAQTGS
jgi:hypothetical protein